MLEEGEIANCTASASVARDFAALAALASVQLHRQ
jgi:hypothetical protein